MPDIRLEPFKAEHVALLADYGEQEWLRPYFEEMALEAERGSAIAVFAQDDFIGCGGIVPVHDFRAVAWAIFMPGFPQHFLAVHLHTRTFLLDKLKTFRRIEAYIDPEFFRAVRWVKALGFHCETDNKPYFFPDGRTGSEWVMLRGGD